MRRIVLLCSAGVSTSMLVRRLEAEAARLGYECSISFFPISEANEAAGFADALLLAPQAAHMLAELRVKCPNVPIAAIPQEMYGSADAEKILDLAQKTAGDY